MKILPNDYIYMRDIIRNCKEIIPSLKAQIALYPRVKDPAKRLRWDMSNYADLTQFYCAIVYKYTNDSHIDTALKKIMLELDQ